MVLKIKHAMKKIICSRLSNTLKANPGNSSGAAFPSRGYAEAQKLLKTHFGDGFKIGNAYMEKAVNWSNIKAEDGTALHDYALYLRGCCNAMNTLKSMDNLE